MPINTAFATCAASSASSPQPWEAFIRTSNDDQDCKQSVSEYLEMIVEKKEEDIFGFMQEESVPYRDEYSYRDEKVKFCDADLQDEISDFFFEEERSQCAKKESDLEDCCSTFSTDNGYDGAERASNFENETTSSSMNENFVQIDDAWLEVELTDKSRSVLQHKSDEEKNYIDQVWPFLLQSLKQVYRTASIPLTEEVVGTLLEQLLQGKQAMIGAERVVLNKLVTQEMNEVQSSRPTEMIDMEELNTNTRKEKVAHKGNKNTSSLNHLNENYVSNIFQFAKRNYPEDRGVQKIGNERNISATSFKKMTQARMTDDIMMRRARARINGSGQELVGNIEYWMRDGYFDQCADRQKYLHNKEKALRDLALSGQH